MKKFEDSVNNKSVGSAFYSSIQTENIEAAFDNLVKFCEKESQEIAELPLFTTIATAHVQFSNFMEKNAVTHPRIKMTKEGYQRYFESDLKTLPSQYADYVMNVQKKTHEKIYSQIEEVVKGRQTGNGDTLKAF
ncbi:insecticidal delta-endotoxin Cry8Ea1 family protein [Bacillus cereus]|uniref:insecticidal delta-endotoxin Cry8Ea1 family protein n=1 Tax=Bacillus cereus TaxID=1396 RepID=UPI0018F54004|nr:insecticidal delta-endotoxin Cry8Ea1 family protein [Bacillus cereus]MBJ8025934.1 hypothetical protein [Bacillus cereus]MBJ8038222.1 hypothetical protein [Bacillus cereus]